MTTNKWALVAALGLAIGGIDIQDAHAQRSQRGQVSQARQITPPVPPRTMQGTRDIFGGSSVDRRPEPFLPPVVRNAFPSDPRSRPSGGSGAGDLRSGLFPQTPPFPAPGTARFGGRAFPDLQPGMLRSFSPENLQTIRQTASPAELRRLGQLPPQP